jgi:hypothetical protein
MLGGVWRSRFRLVVLAAAITPSQPSPIEGEGLLSAT